VHGRVSQAPAFASRVHKTLYLVVWGGSVVSSLTCFLPLVLLWLSSSSAPPLGMPNVIFSGIMFELYCQTTANGKDVPNCPVRQPTAQPLMMIQTRMMILMLMIMLMMVTVTRERTRREITWPCKKTPESPRQPPPPRAVT
jgi:hypothetical protein